MGPKKKIKILIITLSLLFVLLVGSLYLFYVSMKTCQNEECFNSALIKCARVYFVNDGESTIMQYKIQGRSGENCKINIQLLQVKRGSAELAVLEGKEMDCYTPLGIFTTPESDIKNCHGLLKEEIQDMIIKRMHAQIVENLGKISDETTKVL